jgi:hypothetical protein
MSKGISSVLIEMDENITNATTIKNMVIAKLYENKEISDEIAEKYIKDWQIIIVKESWYKKLFNGDGWKYIFTKLN